MKQKHFQVKAVKAVAPCKLIVTFGDDAVMDVDMGHLISRNAVFAPLQDVSLFLTAYVNHWGTGVVWIEDELDIAGDNLRAEALEQVGGISHERIWEWMHRNKLTLDTAAEALGISRRMLAYYRTGEKAIPRHLWLACLGWERFVAEGNSDEFKKAA